MDDEDESLRDIILGCLIALPPILHMILKTQLEKALKTNRHKEHLETLIKTVQHTQLSV